MMFLDVDEHSEKIQSFWNTNRKPPKVDNNRSKVKTSKNTCSILNGNKLNEIQDDDYSDDDEYESINEIYNRRSNHFKTEGNVKDIKKN